MNDDGVGVGHTSQSLTVHRATLYWNGKTYDLNDRIVNNPNIGVSEFLHVATGINAEGQITGKFGPFAIEEPLFPIGSRAFVLTPVEPCALLADLDGDNEVGLGDLGIVLANFGCTGGGCTGDVDGDGDTDLSDLGAVLGTFGETCP
jgi:hypothetical protein